MSRAARLSSCGSSSDTFVQGWSGSGSGAQCFLTVQIGGQCCAVQRPASCLLSTLERFALGIRELELHLCQSVTLQVLAYVLWLALLLLPSACWCLVACVVTCCPAQAG